jgi:BASS family bile acid:Na+ symporter
MNPTQLILLSMKVSVILSVFALGLEASLSDVTYLLRNLRQLVRALMPMYLVMPLVAGIMVSVFSNIHPAAKIALVALSVSPIPPLLPKKLMKAGGTESYSIGLMVAISLLAIAFVPLAIELFEIAFKRPAGISPAVVAEIVLTMILVPLAIGIAIRYLLPALAEQIVKPLSVSASVLLLVGTLFILFNTMPAIISLFQNGTVVAIIIFILIGLGAGHSFGGPNPNDRTVLALSTVSRHPGMAIAIAHTNFPEQKLAFAAIALYLLANTVVTVLYLKSRKRAEWNQT